MDMIDIETHRSKIKEFLILLGDQPYPMLRIINGFDDWYRVAGDYTPNNPIDENDLISMARIYLRHNDFLLGVAVEKRCEKTIRAGWVRHDCGSSWFFTFDLALYNRLVTNTN